MGQHQQQGRQVGQTLTYKREEYAGQLLKRWDVNLVK